MLDRCSPEDAPWYVIPADRKWYRDLAVSEIVADALAEMKPKPPKVDLDVRRLRSLLVRPQTGEEEVPRKAGPRTTTPKALE